MVQAGSSPQHRDSSEVISEPNPRIKVVPVPHIRLRLVANSETHGHRRRHSKVALKEQRAFALSCIQHRIALVDAVLKGTARYVLVETGEGESPVEVVSVF